MQIITWNANKDQRFRYDTLWNDPVVSQNQWDIICLQEVGNAPPRGANWREVEKDDMQIDGANDGMHIVDNNLVSRNDDHENVVMQDVDDSDYVDSGAEDDPEALAEMRRNNSCIVRKFQAVAPGIGHIFITHGEWTKRFKNHLVIITKGHNRPERIADMSNENGKRPILTINVMLTVNRQVRHILVGCVHLLSGNGAADLDRMMADVWNHTRDSGAHGWMLVGDFNAQPDHIRQAALRNHPNPNTLPAAYHPDWPTQHRGGTLDYLLTSETFLLGNNYDWIRPVQGRTAESDHWLQACTIGDAQMLGCL